MGHLTLLASIVCAQLSLSTFALAAQDKGEILVETARNILFVLADDLGVDSLAAYGEGTDFPITPTIDSLAASGVLFRNVWSNPNCSPTRASIMTGRYAFRTGIGDVITETSAALALAEVTIPEFLGRAPEPYVTGAFGKWHLGNGSNGGRLAPNLLGFDHYDGCLRGALNGNPSWINYYLWPRIVNGGFSIGSQYATTATVDSALEWISNRTGPWFAFVSFNAPHIPFHEPPPGLYSEDLTGLTVTQNARPFFKAAIEALDAELGRLLDSIPSEVLANTIVIFAGDNGTPQSITVPPFIKSHGKATVYEGGVNVPLIIAGASLPQAGVECAALVNMTDLFMTFADIAGADPSLLLENRTIDSVSLMPYLDTASLASIRTQVFTERFGPVGANVTNTSYARRALRDDKFKIVVTHEVREFYNLDTDPFETQNLLQGPLTHGLFSRYQSLYQAMAVLLDSP